MGGMTTVSSGEAEKGDFGRVEDKSQDVGGAEERKVAGYGGEKDMDRSVGA
jgi:hypothetical protein